MKLKKLCSFLTVTALCTSSLSVANISSTGSYAVADEWYFAGETCEPLHDTSRDIQAEGVGNPLNFGERNTPADASAAEIRAINHKMTVQEVKYALYKEIDEHWDLISTRLGQPDREKMYALFLGLGSRESTLGEGKIGSDHETAYADGWGVNSAHAYGTLQTAVTAFAGCDPKFMPEDNVPEMFQYDFTESNFYDCIISNHMGIRKILHFAEICINEEGMHGYQVIRNSLKGFNTGWCYMAEDDGAYKTYADEICSMAQFYYNEGHLYDNVFTWTSAGGEMEKYRTANRWDWWGDTEPSMAPIEEKQQTETTTTTTVTETTTTTTTTTSSESTTTSTYSTTGSTNTTAPATTYPPIGTDHDVIPDHTLRLITNPDKIVYKKGEQLDLTGIKIEISSMVYNPYTVGADLISLKSNTPKIEMYSLIADDSQFDSSKEGEYTIIVFINDGKTDNPQVRFMVNVVGDDNQGNETPDIKYGDTNCDGDVSLADAVLIMQSLANPSKYGIKGTDTNRITEQGQKNADCAGDNDGVTNMDALAIQKYMLSIISSLPEKTV